MLFGRGRRNIPSTPSKGLSSAQQKPGAQVSKKGFDFLYRAGQAGQHLPGGPRFPSPPLPLVTAWIRAHASSCKWLVGKPTVPTPHNAEHPGPPPRVSVVQGARAHGSSRAHLPDLLLPLQPPVLMLREPRERFSAEP